MSTTDHYGRTRPGHYQIPTESLPKKRSTVRRQRPAPLAAPEEEYDSDSTVYYEPWSPKLPVQIPIRTPTEAEIKAAGKNPFLLSPRGTDDSSSTPTRFYTPEKSFTNPENIREEERVQPFQATQKQKLLAPPKIHLPEKFEGFLPMLAKQYPHLVPKPEEEEQYFYEVPVRKPLPLPDMSQTTNPFAKPGPHDPYVGSSIVVGLTAKTFKTFIKDVDAAFVLFYDPSDDDGSWAKSSVKKAALVTKRPNHVYAAVDCTKESRLCQSQYVDSYPTLKLYARGSTVNTYADTFLSGEQMKSLVEKVPAVSEHSPKKKDCSIQ